MRTPLFSLLLSFLVFQSCSVDNDNVITTKSFDGVERSLWSDFTSFEKEAADRGISIDLNSLDLTASVGHIGEDGVAGTCLYGSYITNHVTIDDDFWDNASPLLREFVVFHELGHCVLNRGHDESRDGNGQCLSIMQSGVGGCNLAYNINSRDRLLDELFFDD